MRTNTSLIERLADTAAKIPDRPLFIFPTTRWRDEETLTYGDLALGAAAVAATLRDRAAAGRCALLLFPTGASFWEAFMGCLAAGVIAVPLALPNLNRPSELLEGVSRACRPAAILADESIATQLEKRADQHPYFQGVPIVSPPDWCNVLATLPVTTANCDVAFLQYTSGSTSHPKGVQVGHDNLLANLQMIHERMELGQPGDRAVTWLPHFHDMGLVGGYLGTFYARITSWCLPPEEFVIRPLHWLQLISAQRATICGGPDFGYRRCLERIRDEDVEQLDLSSWRVAFVGAEKIRPDTLNQFAEKFARCGFRRNAFFPCYGLGEATLMATGGPVGTEPVIKSISTAALAEQQIASPRSAADVTEITGCGQTIPGSRVAIVDRGGLVVGDEQIGEVCLAGPSVTRGYYQRDDLNDQLFVDLTIDGEVQQFLRTGDLGFLSHGELFITGRCSDLMIIRGKNLHPEDIEARITAAAAELAPAAALAFSTEIGGQEELVVAAELKRSSLRVAEPHRLATAIRQAVSQFFGVDPADILLLRPSSLPKTTSGKLRRHAFRDAYLNGSIAAIYQKRNPP